MARMGNVCAYSMRHATSLPFSSSLFFSLSLSDSWQIICCSGNWANWQAGTDKWQAALA